VATSVQLGAVEAAVGSFAQAGHGFHPAEDLFDPLAYPLAHHFVAMANGAAVKCRAAGATFIGCDVGSDLERAARGEDLSGISCLSQWLLISQ
jgi:hypothetical protein